MIKCNYNANHTIQEKKCYCGWTKNEAKIIYEPTITVITMTVPTPVCPIPTCLCHSRVIRITPKHPIPIPNPLAPSRANSRLSSTLLNLWPPGVLSTHSQPDTPSTSPLPHVKSIPNIHTHSQPDAIRPSLFLHQVYSRCFIGLTTAVGRSSIAYLPCSIRPSLSFLALYTSVSLLSTVHSFVSSFATLHSFLYVSSSVPHLHLPLFHLSLFYPSVDPHFIYLDSILPLTLLCYSVLTLQLIPDCSDQPDPYHTLHLYKYFSYKLL